MLPLSGVVSPFLSSGNTAMLANFLIFALLASISADAGEDEQPGVRAASIRPLRGMLLGVGLVLLGFAAQATRCSRMPTTWRATRTPSNRTASSAPQHNPRMNSIAREIPRGSIYDRNGIPLATSDWAELERHRAEYQALGISLEQRARVSTAGIIRSARRRRM